jgi:hypothetical protein
MEAEHRQAGFYRFDETPGAFGPSQRVSPLFRRTIGSGGSMLRRVTPALLSLALAAQTAALEHPTWKEFTREELFSTHFPEAPGADAVVLFDACEVKVDPKFHLRIGRHGRTKIFTPAGASRGEIRIRFGDEDKILDLEGHTVVPPSRFVKLEKKHVREEAHPDGGRVMIVSFPEVAPGVILEYSYTHWTKQLARIEPWYFQNDDFTRVSTLDLQIPRGMEYESEFGWLAGPTPAPERKTVIDADNPDRELEQSRWTFTNLAPFRAEPWLSNTVDYRTTLRLQLVAVDQGGKRVEIAPSWERLSASVAAGWAAALADDRGVREWAQDSGGATPAERAEALFRKVRDEISDAPASSPFVLPPLRSIVESRTAPPAAKNVLLVHLLRAAGLTADPILVRPRSSGTFRSKWRVLDQLQYVVVRVDLGGRAVYADAGAGSCPLGTLPPDLLVGSGLLVAASGGSLVDLGVTAPSSSAEAKTVARLDSSGTLSGATECTFTGYEALQARREIRAASAADFARRLLARNLGEAGVDSVEVEGLDVEGAPLVMRAVFQTLGWSAAGGGDRIECRLPFVFARPEPLLGDRPRAFPLELPFPTSHDESVRLDLPETYRVAQAPPGGRAGNEDLSYSLGVDASEQSVTAQRRFVVREAQIQPARSAGVREIDAKALSCDSATLVGSRRAFGSAAR